MSFGNELGGRDGSKKRKGELHLLGDILEVLGASLVSTEPSCEGDEKFGEGRMNVHEEGATDVLRVQGGESGVSS